MSLPVYQHIVLKNENFEDAKKFFQKEMNLKHPIVFNLKNLEPPRQQEFIKFSEYFFKTHNIAYKFPYPIFFVSDLLPEDSKLLILNKPDELPQFYSQKESKLNVKEAHLVSRNKLLQQEIMNADSSHISKEILKFYSNHEKISLLEEEKKFYKKIMNQLMKTKNHG